MKLMPRWPAATGILSKQDGQEAADVDDGVIRSGGESALFDGINTRRLTRSPGEGSSRLAGTDEANSNESQVRDPGRQRV